MTELVSELICIRTGSSGTPLFCMHYGNFTTLSAALTMDRAIYGFRTTDLKNAPGDLNIEQLAHRYLEQLRTVQAHGPYWLFGYSFGGLVAYEMARCLIDAGEAIALLGLFDAPNPAFRDGLKRAELDRVQKKYRADRRRKYWLNLRSGRFGRLALDMSRLTAKTLDPLLGRIRHLATSKTGRSTDVSEEARINVLWHSYKPKRLDSRLVLFRAQGRDAEFGDDDSMGWRQCVTQGVDIQFSRGIHEEMMHSPYAEHLATLVAPYVRAAGELEMEAPGAAEP